LFYTFISVDNFQAIEKYRRQITSLKTER